MPNTIRRHVYFSGRVQGVGFRFTTRQIASEFAVAGFVRNLPDGRVEMVAEGGDAEVEAFYQALQERLGRYIHDTAIATEPPTGERGGFRIAY